MLRHYCEADFHDVSAAFLRVKFVVGLTTIAVLAYAGNCVSPSLNLEITGPNGS